LPILDLRGDRPRPPLQTFAGACADFHLPRTTTAALEQLAHDAGASRFMALLAGFASLLGRYAGQDDFAVGTYIANRTHTALEVLIGFFVNNLPLRIDLAGAPSGRQLLARLRETTLAAYAHQDLPFEKLIAEVPLERDRSRAPIVQATLNLLNFPAVREELPDLTLSGAGARNERASCDVTLWLEETVDGLAGWLEYNTDLFDAATIARLAGHLDRLLAGLATEPDRRVAELPLLSPAEAAQLRVWGNGWDHPQAAGSVQQRIEEQAVKTPAAIALVSGGERLTYRELNARANRLARWLAKHGVRTEERIGLALDRSASMVIALLAVLKAGGAYVPLDPAHPRERLQKIVDDARPRLLLRDVELDLEAPPAALWVDLREPAIRGEISAEAEEDLDLPCPPASLAYVLFTSGSTGRPKGVQISHAALVNFLAAMEREPGLGPDDVMLAVTTLSFDIAALELLLPLWVGARIELASRDEARDGEALCERIERTGVTVLQGTPATWRMLLDSGFRGNARLRALCGGEALPGELAARLLPRTREVWNLYGPTETTVWSAASRVVLATDGTVP
ncbi:MAG TPA: AMP-binding protein, partial [Thermoanaerobaculia bacterium]